MKIFTDKELTKEVTELLDLGIVNAGDTKTFSFWIFNDTMAVLHELVFDLDHNEARVVEAPENLDPRHTGVLIIEWSPTVTLKEGLKTQLRISARELWG